MVNSFVLGLLAMLVRYGVVYLAGALGLTEPVQQYINDNMSQFTQFSLAAAGVLLTVGYAIWKRVTDRKKLLQALQEAGRSEKSIELMVKDKLTPTPSVMTDKHVVPST